MINKLVILFAISLNVLSFIPTDMKPFCRFPEVFHTTIRPLQKKLDLNKYGGTWYEIIRAPLSYEKGCVCNSAFYKYDFNKSKLYVKNTCVKANG